MNSKKTVLLAGYAQMIATDIAACIENEGYEFLHEDNISQACSIIISRSPHLVILEISLTDRTGFDVCHKIRQWYDGLILILIDQGDDLDQILAFEFGADDVIILPVWTKILQSRLRALLRRLHYLSRLKQTRSISIGELTLNAGGREAYLNGKPLELSAILFDMLWHLMKNAGYVVSHYELCRAVFDIEYDRMDRTIDKYITLLRQKIGDDPVHPRYLKTIRDQGYLFSAYSQADKRHRG
jgi:two-component system, OmpR family, response regulator RstA